jgi:hypothetical protein
MMRGWWRCGQAFRRGMVGTYASVLSLFVVIVLAIPTSAHGECVALWKTARDAQRGSTLVFSGTVIKSAEESLQTTFAVDRVWKGKVRQQTTLTLYPGLESHGASYFEEGVAYLVFAIQMPVQVRTDRARSEMPVFEISGCSPTRPLADAQELVKQLGRATPPLP